MGCVRRVTQQSIRKMGMFEQGDLFALMGYEPEITTSAKKEVNKKKDNKSKQAASVSKSKSNSNMDKVTLPATVYTGYSEPRMIQPSEFGGNSEVLVKDVHEFLEKELADYPMGISSLQKGKENVLYLIHKHDYKVSKPSIHLMSETKLMFAGTTFDISAVKTADVCDVEKKDLEKLFHTLFHKYGKVDFIHSANKNVIVPSFSYPVLTEGLSFPVTVGIFGREEFIIDKELYQKYLNDINNDSSTDNDTDNEDEQDDDSEDSDDEEEQDEDQEGSDDDEKLENGTAKSIINAAKASTEKASIVVLERIVCDKYPDFAEGHIELQWNKEAKLVIAKMVEKKDKPNSSTQTVEYYPTNALLSLLYTTIQLTPEMFDGNDTVEKEELRMFIEKDRPEYAKERTNITYDKDKNLIIMVCFGSRKGALLVNDDVLAMEMVSKDEDTLFNWQKGNDLYRVEKTKISCTVAHKSDSRKGSYQLFLPKIPVAIYNIAYQVFKEICEKYNTELMLQLYWDEKSKRYFLFVPEQRVDKYRCSVERDIYFEMEYTLVGDFHSHGTLDAFFSSVDNRDEKGYRLFGVFGNLDKEKHTFLLRAGTGGYYVNLQRDSIFDMTFTSLEGEQKILERLLKQVYIKTIFHN